MASSFYLALLTGASSGIGEKLAYLLADKGVNLILQGRNVQALEKIAKDLQKKVHVDLIVAELGNSMERKQIVEKIHEKVPDLVINNAGYGLIGDALTYETCDQLTIIEVNAMAVLELTLEAARALSSYGKKGVILNVSSVAGELPLAPGLAVYSAAKAMVNHFSKSLDIEFKDLNIRVLASCPGRVKTNFQQRAGGNMTSSKSTDMLMTSEFAAQEIWRQLESEKRLHVFDLKTRLLVLIAKLIPQNWFAKLYRKYSFEGRTRPIIKIKTNQK